LLWVLIIKTIKMKKLLFVGLMALYGIMFSLGMETTSKERTDFIVKESTQAYVASTNHP